MSGGERSRAVLAGLLASAKNVIVLDEPTNHLDIPSAERLEDAMCMDGGFDGTMILISHDRALIDATCDHLIVLDGNGNAEVFMGNYTEWATKHAAEQKRIAAELANEKARKEDAQRKQRQAEERKKAEQAAAQQAAKKFVPNRSSTGSALERMSQDKLEAQITKLETRMKAIDAEMATDIVWRDPNRANQLGDERAKLANELQPLEFEWARRAE